MYVGFERLLSTPTKSHGQEQSKEDWICVSNLRKCVLYTLVRSPTQKEAAIRLLIL